MQVSPNRGGPHVCRGWCEEWQTRIGYQNLIMRRVRSAPYSDKSCYSKAEQNENFCLSRGVEHKQSKNGDSRMMSKSNDDHSGALLNIPSTDPAVRSRAA